MKLCRPFYSKHEWKRYDDLVEQLFVGGTMAWQRCSKCEKIRFDWCDKSFPAEPDIAERKAELKRIMAKDYGRTK